MLKRSNGLAGASSVAVALVVVLALPATFAQRATDRASPPRTVEEFVPDLPRFTGRGNINLPTGKALNGAIAALNAKNYAEARAVLGKLRLDRLTPYERGKTEQVLFNIAYGEQKYVEAREHLQKAIDSGGLSEQEVAQARRQIQQIAARIATAPLA
jgi:flagellar basal body rod protein FlgF